VSSAEAGVGPGEDDGERPGDLERRRGNIPVRPAVLAAAIVAMVSDAPSGTTSNVRTRPMSHELADPSEANSSTTAVS